MINKYSMQIETHLVFLTIMVTVISVLLLAFFFVYA